VIAVAFGVVAFSVVIQGLTIMPLLKQVARDEPPEQRD